MKKNLLTLGIVFLLPLLAVAQNALSFQNIGPTVMSGRVVDTDVNPENPSEFYTAYASGGLWYTNSNGAKMTPIFDDQKSMTIGDIAVDWKSRTIWVGSGECNSSRSSYSGDGIYKSSDNGKTWQNTGLPETHHIGRVVLDPKNPNTVLVAALGHLYTPNSERGVFKTKDGGKTWQRTLFVNDSTGIIDLVFDAANPQIVYAAAWEKDRKAWNFKGSGKSSGIYKSVDGGDTWSLASTLASGFPQGEGVGRIGLASGKGILYAVLDNQANKPKKDKKDNKKDDVITKDQLRNISKADFLKLDKKQLDDFLRNNDFPEKYFAQKIMDLVQSNQIKPQALVEYLEDANTLLFETDVIGAEVYSSVDEGKTWKITHEAEALKGVFFTYGYYFAQIIVNATNPKEVYVLGTRIVKSEDGGKNWRGLQRENSHWDHHSLWVNSAKKGHLINGNDGGLHISYDDGDSWFKCNSPSVGQFYNVNVDMADNYHVYGGLQDNGVWYAPHTADVDNEWQATGQNPYKSIMGGDGMQVVIDNRDNTTVYTGFQFGNYFRINRWSPEGAKSITPQHELGERPLRWNWQSPIHLSKFNQDILYFGANRLYRSLNKGNDWEAISADLTNGGKKGNVAYGTLTAIHESPLSFGLLYTGSDDGLVHVSKNGGESWKNINAGLPQGLWVSRIQASAFEKNRVYLSLNGYRNDDFKSYVYTSTDCGDTWQKIGNDLPNEAVNVIKEDPKNPNIVYVGTDHSLFISMNKGLTFERWTNGLPNVPVHDLVIHPKANDLIIGTHGRSLYLTSVEHLQQLSDTIQAKEIHLFALKNTKQSRGWGREGDKWAEKAEIKPSVKFPIFVKNGGKVTINIIAADKNTTLQTIETTLPKGVQYYAYDLTDKEKKYLTKGKYKVAITLNGKTATADWVIE